MFLAYKKISGRVERYNPNVNQWEVKRSLTTPRFFSMLASVGSRLYLIGGATIDDTGNVICVPCVDIYVPLTDTWCTSSPMLQPRAEAGFAVINKKIYVVGGYSWDKSLRLSSVEYFDTEKNSWKMAKDIDQPYTGVACGALTIYNFTESNGGQDGGRLKEWKLERRDKVIHTVSVTHTPHTNAPLNLVKNGMGSDTQDSEVIGAADNLEPGTKQNVTPGISWLNLPDY